MNSKKKRLMFLGMIAIIVLGFCFLFLYLKKLNDNNIPTDYIAIFHGGVGEQTYETYIYEVDNGDEKIKFKFINVTSTTVSWGSADWTQEINELGTLESVDDIFLVAKKHGAYSYVTVPNDDNLYSIEEFERIMFK